MEKKEILSTSNEKIKYLKKLGDKKFRDKEGEFLVENLRVVHDAFKAGLEPEVLFFTEEMLSKNDEKKIYILKNTEEYFIITDKVNKFFSNLATPAGIAAVYKKKDREIEFKSSIIYLNAVSDPGNLGTILRTALAFDLKNIVVDEKCADIYNPKTISATRDAIFKLNITHDKDLKVFSKIKKEMKVYATNLEKGKGVESIKDRKFCVVLGNEANGVDPKILKKADGFIKIEMSGNIESLNVGVSAGIIFNEIFKNL